MRSLLNFLGAAWAERSAREQILLGSLSLVIGFLALWYLVAAPLVEFRNTSRAAYTDSVERYRELSVGIARYQALLSEEGRRASADNRPLRTIVSERAAAMELPLSRMVPDEAGRLNVWTGNADAERVMNWLADLEQRHAIVAIRANIDREGDGRARAQIVLERSGG
ncbi:MAG: hypothetical protein COW29_05270 [Rhodobacterales bacterium CG15_BIG_FIL_POST_REV_8_21_14_020_59_13]|nr:MAG: hypothetical protein COW29_05270 [Rhodobacterales bacterium CG15_BIG_FIL_POST_REV_8_21_14_020_59_13]